jgi:hypothetical protein
MEYGYRVRIRDPVLVPKKVQIRIIDHRDSSTALYLGGELPC